MAVNSDLSTEVSDFYWMLWFLLHISTAIIQYKKTSQLKIIPPGTLLSAVGLFVSVPLYNPLLDILVPLNETRPKQNVFSVNYVILDDQKYFYISYVHLALSSMLIVVSIVTVDSLYITIIYHACGLLAVCG